MMGLFDRFTRWFMGDDVDLVPPMNSLGTGFINPASGLPMQGEIDLLGNPFGFDLHHHSLLGASLHDPFPSSPGSDFVAASGLDDLFGHGVSAFEGADFGSPFDHHAIGDSFSAPFDHHSDFGCGDW